MQNLIKKFNAQDKKFKIFFLMAILFVIGSTATAVGVTQKVLETVGVVSKEAPLQVNSFIPPDGYTWEVHVAYDQKSHGVTVENVSILGNIILSDLLKNFISPYTATVIDKSGKNVFSIKVNPGGRIIQEGKNVKSISEKNHTILYIPYIDSGEKLIIQRDYKTLVTYTLPKRLFSFANPFQTKKTYAASNCPKPLSFVIAGEGYANASDFQQHVSVIKEAFSRVVPFNENQQVLEVNVWGDGRGNPFQCKGMTARACLSQQTPTILSAITKNYPDASHIIVLEKNSLDTDSEDGATMIGGNVAIIQVGSTKNEFSVSYNTVHEVGHFLYLNDRYIAPDEFYRANLLGDYVDFPNWWVKSNCSFNSIGEQFWNRPTNLPTVTGCGGVFELYAPTARNCSGNPWYGPERSVMGLCNKVIAYDGLEIGWLRNYIFNTYQGMNDGLQAICRGQQFENNSFSTSDREEFPLSGIRFIRNMSGARCQAGDCSSCDINTCRTIQNDSHECFVYSGGKGEDPLQCVNSREGLLPGFKKGAACGKGYCLEGQACSEGECVDAGSISNTGACCNAKNGECALGSGDEACTSGFCSEGVCCTSGQVGKKENGKLSCVDDSASEEKRKTLPDFIISQAPQIDSEAITIGTYDITAKGKIKNIGVTYDPQKTQVFPAVSFCIDDSSRNCKDINTLLGGQFLDTTLNSNTEYEVKTQDSKEEKLEPGVHTITLCVESDQKIQEADENNNCVTKVFKIGK